MLLLKKIDIYIFKRFFTLFLMTFMICIFILLMQFLWKHFAELVGKGIGLDVLAEFFVYSIFTLVPMALPLAILLASLMTFGNMGENFELTAMKSAGISLFRIIRPLIVFIALVSIGAFYFSNHVLPVSQTKLWTLIFSLRQKSPELDIPAGEFYSGINGLNLYVREKENGLLKHLMIYDFSEGFNNATVMVADSGRISISEDKKYLLLTLFDGESFENLKNQQINSASSNIPYRRENFSMKEILLDFDSEFNRLDESILEDQHVSKNIDQLSHSIDSVNEIVKIRVKEQQTELVERRYFGRESSWGRSLEIAENIQIVDYDPDSLFLKQDKSKMELASTQAISRANDLKSQIEYNKIMLNEPKRYVSRHQIEWHRKFTLSFACLIFFFIGAPLGAIIRKGGLGTPVVISVIMFIIYYIIDNTGYKMAREGLWTAAEGMWLSSSVLLPIGIFLTYKAAVDATLFNSEEYLKFIQQIKVKLVLYYNNTILHIHKIRKQNT
ncbi:MAG: LptF/LptG family permease [Paludibacteraceae bacterium]|nr:LptF/LptG family permease [Paludibacteraceae bacterium]